MNAIAAFRLLYISVKIFKSLAQGDAFRYIPDIRIQIEQAVLTVPHRCKVRFNVTKIDDESQYSVVLYPFSNLYATLYLPFIFLPKTSYYLLSSP